MGVAQRGNGPCLPLEAFLRRGLVREAGGEDLDGDGPFQSRVSSAVDLSHATSAEWREDLVRAEAGSWRKSHVLAQHPPRNRRVRLDSMG